MSNGASQLQLRDSEIRPSSYILNTYFLGASVILGVPGETEDEMKETINFCKQTTTANIGMGRFCPLPGSPSYSDLVKSGKVDPRKTDWELLGNFSRLDGECFADIDPNRFRKILSEFNRYCNRRNMESFTRNNMDLYPDLTKQYQKYARPSVGRRLGSYARRELKKVTPRIMRAHEDPAIRKTHVVGEKC